MASNVYFLLFSPQEKAWSFFYFSHYDSGFEKLRVTDMQIWIFYVVKCTSLFLVA